MPPSLRLLSLLVAILVQTAVCLGGDVASPRPLPESLTPPPAPTPRINGPTVFGVRPGNPFFYSIPATGDRPMTFAVDGLPSGLTLNTSNGRITGALPSPGEYRLTLRAENTRGRAAKEFRIVVGEDIALTPTMGWNSYNCFGERVTQELALRAAKQIIALGLDRHGWTYVNMDDGWQGGRTGPTRALQADPAHFPDVKGMVDEIHALGLKAGLYSTPWVMSYGRKPGGSAENPEGTLQEWPKAPHNRKVLPYSIGRYRFDYVDANQYAEWGFDYLKLDWGPVEAPEACAMHQALRLTGRDIVLSLSNNHEQTLFRVISEVSPWAQSWRTTLISATPGDAWRLTSASRRIPGLRTPVPGISMTPICWSWDGSADGRRRICTPLSSRLPSNTRTSVSGVCFRARSSSAATLKRWIPSRLDY